MPIVEKQLLIPGKRYRSRNAKGEQKAFVASPETIEAIYSSGNDLIATGYDIPIPFEHDLDLLMSLNGRSKGGLVDDLHRNAGFIQKFVKNNDGSLSAFLDIPNQTTADKLGKEIRGASLAIKEEFIDVDIDRNKTWKKAPLHLALTNKQTAVGTRTFQKIEDAVLLSLDEEDSTEDSDSKDSKDPDTDPGSTDVGASGDALLKELRKGLKDKFGIVLSETTNQANLLQHLALIVPNMPKMVSEDSLQKKGEGETPIDQEEKDKVEDEIENMPEGSKKHQGAQETGVWTMSLEAENKALKDQIDVLLSRQSDSARKSFKTRAQALEGRGISKDVLNTRIHSVLDKKNDKGELVLLSQADEVLVDTLLSVLEETAAKAAKAQDDEDEDILLSQQVANNSSDDDEDGWKEISKNIKFASQY